MYAEDEFYHDPDFAAIYDAQNGERDDFVFCAARAKSAASLLDIGCGTGSFSASLAGRVNRITGVDPAKPMLDIARKRPGGDAVRWVQADACHLDLGERFDLIVMLGHAFQCLLQDTDQRALFSTIARHLAPGGQAIFDSRNPLYRGWEAWTKAKSLHSFPGSDGPVETWLSHSVEPGEIISYTHQYRFADGRKTETTAHLRFAPRETLEAHIAAAGLTVAELLGDWRGTPWTPDAAELVYVLKHGTGEGA